MAASVFPLRRDSIQRSNALLIVAGSILTLVLSGCGGGSDESGIPSGNNPNVTKDGFATYKFQTRPQTFKQVTDQFGPATQISLQDVEKAFDVANNPNDKELAKNFQEIRKRSVPKWYGWRNGNVTFYAGFNGADWLQVIAFREKGGGSGWIFKQ
jgi:hypothetical protein